MDKYIIILKCGDRIQITADNYERFTEAGYVRFSQGAENVALFETHGIAGFYKESCLWKS